PCVGLPSKSKSAAAGSALAISPAPMIPGAASPPRRNERRVEQYDLIRLRMIFSWWQYCVRLSAAPFEHVGSCTRAENHTQRTDIIFIAGKLRSAWCSIAAEPVAPQSTVINLRCPGLHRRRDVKQLT